MKYTILLLVTTLIVPLSLAQEKGVINTGNSPHVKLKSIDIGDCQWTDGFWGDKFNLCEEVMVPYMGTVLKGDVGHALNNFKIAAGLKDAEFQGMWWHDGDFYKWMEAAMYVYAINKDEKILKELDEYIALFEKVMTKDGYLDTPVQINGWKPYTERRLHEMYNSGHLLTAACIHYRTTGQKNFLNLAIRHADHLYDVFMPQPPELHHFGFNQTQITGLVELYRTVGDKRYLDLAQMYVDRRGTKKVEYNQPGVRNQMIGDMSQDRTPIRKETEAEGHAVLAMYFYAGAADLAAEIGDKDLIDALNRIWANVVNQKMYITGAIGQSHHGGSRNVDFVHEAFIDNYMMPNSTAYNETCANLCNAMFNYRMLGINGESKHADIMELVLLNSGLSGISDDGTHYFYTNPLRRTHHHEMDTTDSVTREPYLNCFCCPPNLVRTIAKSSAWAYSLAENGLAVNLYGSNILDTNLLDGSALKLKQETNYPWEGAVGITIEECKQAPFEILVRIPGWAAGTTVKVNGKAVKTDIETGKYARLKRKWKKGDVITIDMPMEAKLVEGHPLIEEVRNQAAIQRGPVVYCLETPDLPENTSILDVYLPVDASLDAEYKGDFLGGLTTIVGEVYLRDSKWDAMYSGLEKPDWKKTKVTFVPYFAWSNRGEAEMSVWLPLIWN